MKFSFVAVALLAARATAIPVAAGDAAGSQDTHGALGLPGTDALTGLAEKLGVPVEALLEQLLGALKGVVPVKRGEEGGEPVNKNTLVDVDAANNSLNYLNLPLDKVMNKVLALLDGLLGKRDTAADVGGFVTPVEGLLKELFGTVEDLLEDGTKALSKELSDTLSLLKDLLGKILKSDNKNLNENTLIKVSALNNSLNNLLK